MLIFTSHIGTTFLVQQVCHERSRVTILHPYWLYQDSRCSDGVERVDMEGAGSTRSGLRLKVVKMVFSNYYLH